MTNTHTLELDDTEYRMVMDHREKMAAFKAKIDKQMACDHVFEDQSEFFESEWRYSCNKCKFETISYTKWKQVEPGKNVWTKTNS